MYFVVVCAAAGAALPALPALSLFDDGALALWRDYARALVRERQLAWDELDARAIAQDRLAELVTAVNALAGEKARGHGAGSRASRRWGRKSRPRGRNWRGRPANMRRRATRLAYRESARGWLRLPLLRC